MAKFGLKTAQSAKPTWQTYIDDGDGEPVRFLLNDWTRTAHTRIDELLKDRDHIKSLGLVWDDEFVEDGERKPRWKTSDGRHFPYGTGERKTELRTIVTAEYLIQGWENVVGDDGKTPLECEMFSKVWLMERTDVGLWAFQRGQEGGGKVVEEDAKN